MDLGQVSARGFVTLPSIFSKATCPLAKPGASDLVFGTGGRGPVVSLGAREP